MNGNGVCGDDENDENDEMESKKAQFQSSTRWIAIQYVYCLIVMMMMMR